LTGFEEGVLHTNSNETFVQKKDDATWAARCILMMIGEQEEVVILLHMYMYNEG
jgi:hypothetical protein